MAVFRGASGRRRTRRLDLEGPASKRRSVLTSLFAPRHLLSTLTAAAFWIVESAIVLAGTDRGPAATAAAVALLAAANGLCGWHMSLFQRPVLRDRRRLLLVQSVTLLVISLGKIFVVAGWPEQLIPLAVFSVGLALGVDASFAVLWTVLTAGVLGLAFGLEAGVAKGAATHGLSVAVMLGGGGLVGILALDRVSRRGKVIRAGVLCGAAYAALMLLNRALVEPSPELWAELHDLSGRLWRVEVPLALLNGLATGYFLLEFGIRFVESAFDVVTDLTLTELADLNQPVLKKFAIEAPGTFHHSQMVGTLAEAAAEAVGGNPLLCRVGAHFHDIGKLAKPEYFIENVRGPTKHQNLTATMSTLIIIGHVKDGIEIAEELGLPSQVISFIPEHHGTIAVEYFFHAAKKKRDAEGGAAVSLDDFRYPGPKPQSKETAILMVADTVEAVSRVLEDPNPARLGSMVRDVVTRRLNQGQFDECAITLKELREVEAAMVRVLLGAHHGRIKYPKPEPEETKPLVGKDPQSQADLAQDLAEGPGLPSAAAVKGVARRDVRPGARAVARGAEVASRSAQVSTEVSPGDLAVAADKGIDAGGSSGREERAPVAKADAEAHAADAKADAESGAADAGTVAADAGAANAGSAGSASAAASTGGARRG